MTWMWLMVAACAVVLHLVAWICSDPFADGEDVAGDVDDGDLSRLRRGMERIDRRSAR